MGNRRGFLRKSIKYLSTLGTIVSESSIYETSPVGMEAGTEKFFNSVVLIDSEITPEVMIVYIKRFEKKMGRNIVVSHLESRQIDIDIIFAGNTIIKTKALEIPHPELHKRKFVLEPLVEILPEFIHPVSGKTMKELLDKLKNREEIKIVKTDNSDPS